MWARQKTPQWCIMTVMLKDTARSLIALVPDLKKVKGAATSTLSRQIEKQKERRDNQYIVALDIGTHNVKALIGSLMDDGTVEIIGVGRQQQGLSDMQAGAIADISAVTANCNKALAQAEKQAGVSARAVVIGIAGELVKGTTVSVKVNRTDGSVPLDIDETERIIEAVQKRAFKRAKAQIAQELGGKTVEVQLVNSALVRMEIDGYAITNPIGFKGSEVSVQLYTACAPMIHIGALEQVARQLDMDLLAVAAEPFAVARSIIGDAEDSSMNAVLMDIGGGTTDIAVVLDGGVQGTSMFGVGGRAFTRSIARSTKLDFDEAEKIKTELADGGRNPGRSKRVEIGVKKTLQVWRSGVELALAEFEKLDHIPHTILLCGGGASLPHIKAALSSEKWQHDIAFARLPAIQHIAPESVVGIVDRTDRISDHTYITAMGLLRVGVDTIAHTSDGDETTASRVRDRINKLLRI